MKNSSTPQFALPNYLLAAICDLSIEEINQYKRDSWPIAVSEHMFFWLESGYLVSLQVKAENGAFLWRFSSLLVQSSEQFGQTRLSGLESSTWHEIVLAIEPETNLTWQTPGIKAFLAEHLLNNGESDINKIILAHQQHKQAMPIVAEWGAHQCTLLWSIGQNRWRSWRIEFDFQAEKLMVHPVLPPQ